MVPSTERTSFRVPRPEQGAEVLEAAEAVPSAAEPVTTALPDRLDLLTVRA